MLISLGVICFIAALSPSETPTTEKENKTTTPAETGTAGKIFNLGDKVAIGGMEYTVDKDVFATPALGSGYVNKQADGIFIVLSITIKNNGKNEVFLTSNSFKLKDFQEREYNADAGAGIYLSTMGLNGLVLKNLGAGLSTNGGIVFDVPADDTGLVLEITGEGIFAGTEYVKIGNVADFD